MKKLFLSLLFLLIPATAQAELRVDITRGVVEPMPIAITTFLYSAPAQRFCDANPASGGSESGKLGNV